MHNDTQTFVLADLANQTRNGSHAIKMDSILSKYTSGAPLPTARPPDRSINIWDRPSPNCIIPDGKISKKDANPHILKSNALENIGKVSANKTQFYTDGSLTEQGKVGAGIYCPNSKAKWTLRLNDNATILQAELAAINHAMVLSLKRKSNIVIHTDSLTSLHCLLGDKDRSDKLQVDQILHILAVLAQRNQEVTFNWVPSHMGIKGNEMADQLAKEATQKPNIDLSLPQTIGNSLKHMRHTIQDELDERLESATDSKSNFYIELTGKHEIHYNLLTKKQQVWAAKFRLGALPLNTIFKPKTHCKDCSVPETYEHFFLHCPNFNIAREELISDLRVTDLTLDKATLGGNLANLTTTTRTNIIILVINFIINSKRFAKKPNLNPTE